MSKNLTHTKMSISYTSHFHRSASLVFLFICVDEIEVPEVIKRVTVCLLEGDRITPVSGMNFIPSSEFMEFQLKAA
jgi:hypothetical protein